MNVKISTMVLSGRHSRLQKVVGGSILNHSTRWAVGLRGDRCSLKAFGSIVGASVKIGTVDPCFFGLFHQSAMKAPG